jgi:DNA topoisomerase-3
MVARRAITQDELTALFAKGQTEVLSGFVSSKNKPFSAALAIKDKAISFVFDSPKEGGGEGQALLFDADCPRCKQQLKISINQPNERIFCGNNDFRFFTTVAQRKLSPAEAKELIEKRYLSSRVGYVSKKGKTFSAALQLQEDGNVAFAFED